MVNDRSQLLIEQVLDARARGVQLNIIGQGSKKFLGREARGETVSVEGHCGIVSYQPNELVITVRSGTPVSEIQALLAEDGMALSFEPPVFNGKATIGGTLACHLSGPARPWAGSVRDVVLGIRLINGVGEHLKFGGQVIKNVAGYDVSRLQAGAMGTLGIVTEISLKVMPMPAAEITMVQQLDAGDAIQMMNRFAGKPRLLSAACWYAGELFLRLSGAQKAVQSIARQLPGKVFEEGPAFWTSLREQQLPLFQGSAVLQRFSVRPSAAHVLAEQSWLIDWGGAQRWLGFASGSPYSQTELEKLAEAMGGQVSRYRGGERRTEVFHTQPPGMRALQRRIKQAFDPDGVFNPGRLYSWM